MSAGDFDPPVIEGQTLDVDEWRTRYQDELGYTKGTNGAAHAAEPPPWDDDDDSLVLAEGTKTARRCSRRVVDLVPEILELSKLPRLSWGFDELDRLAPFIVGGVAVVIGATGRGKTSFALHVGRHHATTLGPVLIVSAELSGANIGARMVSAQAGTSWAKVIGGEVPIEEMARMLDVPNMRIVDDIGRDILPAVEVELVAFAEEYPGKPAMVLVDYVQLLPGRGGDPRERVSDNMVALRKLMMKFSAGGIVIAKAGRVAAASLRRGESMGTDATEAGAETGAIEHEALALIALGSMKPADAKDPDGPGIVDASIAKARYGIADKIVPLRFDGATGRFGEGGAAVSASERRAEARAKVDSARVETLARSIRELVGRSDQPLSKAEISRATTGKASDIAAAIKRLEDDDPPSIVQVVGEGAKRRGGHAPFWTPDRAAASGLTVVPRTVREV